MAIIVADIVCSSETDSVTTMVAAVVRCGAVAVAVVAVTGIDGAVVSVAAA